MIRFLRVSRRAWTGPRAGCRQPELTHFYPQPSRLKAVSAFSGAKRNLVSWPPMPTMERPSEAA